MPTYEHTASEVRRRYAEQDVRLTEIAREMQYRIMRTWFDQVAETMNGTWTNAAAPVPEDEEI